MTFLAALRLDRIEAPWVLDGPAPTGTRERLDTIRLVLRGQFVSGETSMILTVVSKPTAIGDKRGSLPKKPSLKPSGES
jgi:hypothetical protein